MQIHHPHGRGGLSGADLGIYGFDDVLVEIAVNPGMFQDIQPLLCLEFPCLKTEHQIQIHQVKDEILYLPWTM